MSRSKFRQFLRTISNWNPQNLKLKNWQTTLWWRINNFIYLLQFIIGFFFFFVSVFFLEEATKKNSHFNEHFVSCSARGKSVDQKHRESCARAACRRPSRSRSRVWSFWTLRRYELASATASALGVQSINEAWPRHLAQAEALTF